jgi:hypothetical protein
VVKIHPIFEADGFGEALTPGLRAREAPARTDGSEDAGAAL